MHFYTVEGFERLPDDWTEQRISLLLDTDAAAAVVKHVFPILTREQRPSVVPNLVLQHAARPARKASASQHSLPAGSAMGLDALLQPRGTPSSMASSMAPSIAVARTPVQQPTGGRKVSCTSISVPAGPLSLQNDSVSTSGGAKQTPGFKTPAAPKPPPAATPKLPPQRPQVAPPRHTPALTITGAHGQQLPQQPGAAAEPLRKSSVTSFAVPGGPRAMKPPAAKSKSPTHMPLSSSQLSDLSEPDYDAARPPQPKPPRAKPAQPKQVQPAAVGHRRSAAAASKQGGGEPGGSMMETEDDGVMETEDDGVGAGTNMGGRGDMKEESGMKEERGMVD